MQVYDIYDCNSRENLELDRLSLRNAVTRVHTLERGAMKIDLLEEKNTHIALRVGESSCLRQGALGCTCIYSIEDGIRVS